MYIPSNVVLIFLALNIKPIFYYKRVELHTFVYKEDLFVTVNVNKQFSFVEHSLILR